MDFDFMKKPKKILLTYSLLLIFLSSLTSSILVKAQDSSETTYKALFLVSNAYGDNYYDIVDKFTEWNWTIETAGISSTVTGCVNHHPARTLHCNLTFDDLDESKIMEYDCVIVPSGGHWSSTLCIGQAVFAYADDLMDGVKVAYFSMTEEMMDSANAKIIHKDVVTDKRIVTGGGGGGLSGGGYTVAPTEEFCEAVKIALKPKNSNLLIYSITGSIGGVLLLSIGIYGVKNRHKIFSKAHKKVL